MDPTSSSPLEYGVIAMGLAGGLAMFLYGMEQMTDALKLVAGGGIKRLLARMTRNRFLGVVTGTIITAVIQSSSVTTVLLVGFISAGLMTLQQSLGVILGANIGTTITAQIIAFKVTKYALMMIAAGFAMRLSKKHDKISNWGFMLMGLGFVFFGMELMSQATKPLRNYEPFIALMSGMDNPVTGIAVAAAFTAVVQSSSATTGVIIVLASQGFISLEAGIALVFGANIGTCVTAMLAAFGKPREALQAALAHVFFKIVGVGIWFAFIPELAEWVRTISPSSSSLEGTARLAAETPRQIANAHTVFNVACTFAFIWFTTPVAWLMRKLAPVKSTANGKRIAPKYLDPNFLETPELALDQARREIARLGRRAQLMILRAPAAVLGGDKENLDLLEDMDEDIDTLHEAIVTYLGMLSQERLSEAQSHGVRKYLAAANIIENIGDTVETNLVATGRERLERNLSISDETREVIESLFVRVGQSVERSVEAIDEVDTALAREVISAKHDVTDQIDEAHAHLARRLASDDPNRYPAFRVESAIIESLKRLFYFAKRLAKVAESVEHSLTTPEEKTDDPSDEGTCDSIG